MDIVKSLKILNSNASLDEKKQTEEALVLSLKSGNLNIPDASLIDKKDFENLISILKKHEIILSTIKFQNFYFQDNEIMNSFLEALTSQKDLKIVNFSRCFLSDSDMSQLLKVLSHINLMSLDLSYTRVKSRMLEEFLLDNSKFYPYAGPVFPGDKRHGLKVLHLNNIDIGHEEVEGLFGAFAKSDSLLLINIESNQIPDELLKDFIEKLKDNKGARLKYLMVSGNFLGSSSLKSLIEYLHSNKSLRLLKLKLFNIDFSSFELFIQAVRRHPELNSLELVGARYHDSYLESSSLVSKKSVCSLKNIADLISDKKMKSLNLGSVCIHRQGLDVFLRAISESETLEHLSFKGCEMDDDSALQFMNVFEKSSLLSFDMDFSKLSQKTLENIAKILSSVNNRSLAIESFVFSYVSLRARNSLIAALEQQNLLMTKPKPVLSHETKNNADISLKDKLPLVGAILKSIKPKTGP